MFGWAHDLTDNFAIQYVSLTTIKKPLHIKNDTQY